MKKFSFTPSLMSVYHEGCQTMPKLFALTIEIMWCLSFTLILIQYIKLSYFWRVERVLFYWDNSHLVMVYNYFHCRHCRFSLLGFFVLKDFTSIFITYWFVVFFWCLCLVLVSGSYWSHKLSLEMFLPIIFYGRVWRIGVHSSLKVW